MTRETAAFGAPNGLNRGKKDNNKFRAPLMVLKLLQGNENSECALSFEIEQREGGFYSGRTDTLCRLL